MSTNVPGVVQPVVLPYPAGANSARTAGIAITNSNNSFQTRLINTQGGKRRKSLRGGTSSSIAVPTFQVLYPEPGAGNQTVNGNIASTTTLGATTSANSVYDSCVGQGSSCTIQATKGGKRKYKKNKSTYKSTNKKGGVKWGCYSGGKKNTKNKKTKRKYKK